MTEKKITKKEMFMRIKEVLTDDSLKEFIDKQIEQLDKRNSYKREHKTPTNKQKVNLEIFQQIIDIMGSDTLTYADIREGLGTGITSQKLTGIINANAKDYGYKVVKSYNADGVRQIALERLEG